jgi:hypothetical protein
LQDVLGGRSELAASDTQSWWLLTPAPLADAHSPFAYAAAAVLHVMLHAQEVLGGRNELAASDIPKLVVAEACFKEALRLLH